MIFHSSPVDFSLVPSFLRLFNSNQARMALAHCDSDADFTAFLMSAGTTPVIVDFFADWWVFSSLFEEIELKNGAC